MRPDLALRAPGAVLLVSCYELGHQPLGIAWPRAFLERAGYAPAHLDLGIEAFDEERVRDARCVGIAVPMHTALRLGVRVAERIRRLNPSCIIAFYGLYAWLNASYLLAGIADAVFGGEFEAPFVALLDRLERDGRAALGHAERSVSRPDYPLPQRAGLPPLERYVHLARGPRRTPAGYVEASRGCLHACLHCPITPVYEGRFVAVPRDVVLADIRQLVAAGAGHITFGDPDFLNGPTHAVKLVRALHAEFPQVTWDCTTKVEHILRHRALFPELGARGGAFVVSAVESLSDVVLGQLEKGHRGADVPVALDIVRGAGMALRPSFVAFTPWTTLADYLALLEFVATADLIDEVDPVQWTIRLLVPPGSALLRRDAIQPYLGPLDRAALTWRWTHPDPRMDALQAEVARLVAAAARSGEPARPTFGRIQAAAAQAAGTAPGTAVPALARRRASAHLTEPWFCCAEPTEEQFDALERLSGAV